MYNVLDICRNLVSVHVYDYFLFTVQTIRIEGYRHKESPKFPLMWHCRIPGTICVWFTGICLHLMWEPSRLLSGKLHPWGHLLCNVTVNPLRICSSLSAKWFFVYCSLIPCSLFHRIHLAISKTRILRTKFIAWHLS